MNKKSLGLVHSFFRVRVVFFVFFLTVFTGCSILQPVKDPLINGIYIKESFKTYGLYKEVYQFLPNNTLFYAKRKFLDGEIEAWLNDESREPLGYLKRGKVLNIYSHTRAGKSLSTEEISSSGGIHNSRFYAFSNDGLIFESEIEPKKAKKNISIYSQEGELLFADYMNEETAIGSDSFIFEYSDHFLLYDARSKRELLRADYIQALKDTDDLMMAYTQSGFGIIDAQGNIILPFMYADMMYLGDDIIAVRLDDKTWEIRKISGEVLLKLDQGKSPSGALLVGGVVPIKEGERARFYSLTKGRYLNYESSRFYPLGYSKKFFQIKGEEGWLVTNNEKVVLPFYLSSAYHNHGYVIVNDLQGTSAVFTEAGEQYSPGMTGSLSPILSEDYASQLHDKPLLEYSRDGRVGLVDMEGNILIEPKYKKIKYLGNSHFLLEPRGRSLVEIYQQGKGVLPIRFSGAKYLDGDIIIVEDQASKYGLWSLVKNDWVLKPQQYDLLYSGFSSQYIKSLISEGIDHKYGVIRKDGTVLYPNKFNSNIHIYKDYLSTNKNKQLKIYRLPDVKEVLVTKGDSFEFMHERYLVVVHVL